MQTKQAILATNVINRYTEYNRLRRVRFECLTNHILPTWKDFTKQQKERNRESSHLFNPLFFFNIGETKHSQLLGFLLTPHAEHGQGNTFLISFLSELGVKTPEAGTWHVTIETGRIDILLRRTTPASVIIIENKSNDAKDQPHQLYRYWFREIHSKNKTLDYDAASTRECFKIIYLPSNDSKRPEQQSLSKPNYSPYIDIPLLPKVPESIIETLSFNEFIVNWIDKALKLPPKDNIRLRTYLSFYQELCKTL
ncbi:PD-(D/E)XK nuclease family protein [Coraliomargarita sp. W4R53]